jgi:hypothetical protein
MSDQVIRPFSYKFNNVRKEVQPGDIIKDGEILPSVRDLMIGKGKLKPLKKEKVSKQTKNKKEPVGRKKINRSSKKEVTKEPIEEPVKKIEVGMVDLSESGLAGKSKSELKRVAAQLGLPQSGTKEILVKRILNSGI